MPVWARIVAQAPSEDLGPPRMPWGVQEGTERASWARAPPLLDLTSNLDNNNGNVSGRNVAAHQKQPDPATMHLCPGCQVQVSPVHVVQVGELRANPLALRLRHTVKSILVKGAHRHH